MSTTALNVLLYLCWALFGAVWLVGAVIVRRRGPAVTEQASRDKTVYAAVAAIVATKAVPASAWRSLSTSGTWAPVVGAVVLVLATAVTLWARLVLGLMWSSGAVAREHHALRTDGPYRLSRHPIYTGMSGMLIGSALVRGLGDSAAIAAAIVVALVFKARAEERLLLTAFPDDYKRYRRDVPMLVPGLRPRPPRT